MAWIVDYWEWGPRLNTTRVPLNHHFTTQHITEHHYTTVNGPLSLLLAVMRFSQQTQTQPTTSLLGTPSSSPHNSISTHPPLDTSHVRPHHKTKVLYCVLTPTPCTVCVCVCLLHTTYTHQTANNVYMDDLVSA